VAIPCCDREKCEKPATRKANAVFQAGELMTVAGLVEQFHKDIQYDLNNLAKKIRQSEAYQKIELSPLETLRGIVAHLKTHGVHGDNDALTEELKDAWAVAFRWVCAARALPSPARGDTMTFEEWLEWNP
jgi:hypothetical protein